MPNLSRQASAAEGDPRSEEGCAQRSGSSAADGKGEGVQSSSAGVPAHLLGISSGLSPNSRETARNSGDSEPATRAAQFNVRPARMVLSRPMASMLQS